MTGKYDDGMEFTDEFNSVSSLVIINTVSIMVFS